jgi:nicotinamide mononucleotide transporter
MLETAFNFLGAPVTWLEATAFVLAVAMVFASAAERAITWPLAITSSALYVWLFAVNKLYGETVVNIFFVLAGVWGWWQWLFGQRNEAHRALQIARIDSRQRMLTILAWMALWIGFAIVLSKVTDSDVPWADAFVTAGSFVGTALLARKLIENWIVWLVVNAASIVVFAYKALWLTAILYAILFVMSIVGYRAWKRKLA